MRGSTRKRGGTWTAYWDVHDPRSGERRQRTKGGFRTQKEAQRHLASVITQVADGTFVEPSKQPLVRFLLDEWAPGIEGTVRPASLRRYKDAARLYIGEHEIGAVPLRGVSPAHVNALYAALKTQGLSDATVRVVHTMLHRSLKDAVRWGKLTRNPVDGADPPALARSRAQAWTGTELRHFLAQVEGDRLFALWRLGATTGMRRGELLGLPWRCLDLEAGTLRVEQQIIPVPGGTALAPPKTKRSERTIALDAATVEALRNHREMQRVERAVAGSAYNDQDLVFCDEIGRPIYPGRLGEWFGKHRKAANISTGTLHILRHTMATLALTGNPRAVPPVAPVPLHIVAARLGDDPRTTLGVYSHLLPSSDSAAAEVLAGVLVDKPLTSGTQKAPETAL